MKIGYQIKRFLFRMKREKIKEIFKDIVYMDRYMVVIEKELHENPIKKKSPIDHVIVDRNNIKKIKRKYIAQNLDYYCKKNATGIIGLKDGRAIGYQWYTQNKKFIDLVKLNIDLKEHEAYLFDFYVDPNLRGTRLPLHIAWETYEHLLEKKIKKIYGFYFSDNIKALWYHRASLKCKEIKKIKAQKLFIFEKIGDKYFLDI